MKIYVLTKGQYSDYHICGVFDNEELARGFVKLFDGSLNKEEYDRYMIEEYEVNPFKMEVGKGYNPYFVRMRKNGEAYKIRIADSEFGFLDSNSFGFCMRGDLYNHCFARDEQHAVKITNELRVRLIAENKWEDK